MHQETEYCSLGKLVWDSDEVHLFGTDTVILFIPFVAKNDDDFFVGGFINQFIVTVPGLNVETSLLQHFVYL